MSSKRKKHSKKDQVDWAEYYDNGDVLKEVLDEDVELALAEELREAILSGKRKHKLQS